MKGIAKFLTGASAFFFFNYANAQTHAEGIINVDSHKFGKAKEVYTALIQKTNSAENYFYLGNTYLKQFEPNIEKAKENFEKGLALDKKSYLNKIGLASIELFKGNKNAAIQSFAEIAKDSREKDTEVLFRIGEALSMFPKQNAPDLAVEYLTKAVEKSFEKGGVPGNFYYTLGDAHRLKKQAGPAMTAYDNAANSSVNKSSVFTRMGTLWLAAQQWEKAKQNIDKAIAADPTYAPSYRALANYYIIYQDYDRAAGALENYKKYADEDPDTTLDISKLYFVAKAYKKSKAELDKIYDVVKDPVKHKMKSMLQFKDKDYAGAKQSMDTYMAAVGSKADAGDMGYMGLVLAGVANSESDAAKKTALENDSSAKIAMAKNAKDESFDWDKELAAIRSSINLNLGSPDSGPQSTKIAQHKAEVAASPNDTTALFNLANAYQDAQNWVGAAMTWQKLIDLLPDWEPSYNNQGFALQKLNRNDLAAVAYQNYLNVFAKKSAADQEKIKESAAYVNYNLATIIYKQDKAKAQGLIEKALALKPGMSEALNLQKIINK